VGKDLLYKLTTGGRSFWGSLALGLFIVLMVAAIQAIGDGPGILAALIAAGAATLFMVFRVSPSGRPAWATWIKQRLSGLFLLVAAGSAAVVGVLVVLHIAR
jgi:hypothetical protein